MVGTIGFAGSKARDRGTVGKWGREVAIPHVVAASAGGALLGLSVGFPGAIVATTFGRVDPLFWVAALMALAIADVLGVAPQRLSRARQVPLSWKHVMPRWMSSTLYGFVLGLGFATTAYFWSFFAFVLGLFLVGDLGVAVAAGAAFGLGRAVPSLTGAMVANESLDALTTRLGHHLNPGRLPARLVSSVLTVAFAVVVGLRTGLTA